MKRLAFLLLWASAAFGQQPVQTVVFPQGDPKTVYTIPLADTKPGDGITLYGYIPDGYTITDMQGNAWVKTNCDLNYFQHIVASKGGPEVVTVSFTQPQYFRGIFNEWPGSLMHPAVIPCRPAGTSGAQSLQYQDDTSTPSSFPLTTTAPNTLVIGYGDSSGPCSPQFGAAQVTPESGWQMAGFANRMMVQYTVVPSPSTVTSTFTQPAVAEKCYVTEGIVGFTLGSPPVLANLNATLTVKYEDGTVPTIYAFGLLDVTSNPQISVLYLQPDPTTGITTGSFLLSSADTYQGTFYVTGVGVASFPFQGGPILALMPQISTLNWTVILCKTSCPAGAVKELVTDTK